MHLASLDICLQTRQFSKLHSSVLTWYEAQQPSTVFMAAQPTDTREQLRQRGRPGDAPKNQYYDAILPIRMHVVIDVDILFMMVETAGIISNGVALAIIRSVCTS